MVELFGLPLSVLLLLVGAALIVAEALAPGAHFIVLGVALFVAGFVGLLLPSAVGPFLPLILAAVVVLAGGIALYGYRSFDLYGGQASGQTSDSASLRGKTGRVTERVDDTTAGEVKLEDGGFTPFYKARALDGVIEEGEEVIVVDPGGGNVVTVASLAGLHGSDDIDRELARSGDDEEGDREADAV